MSEASRGSLTGCVVLFAPYGRVQRAVHARIVVRLGGLVALSRTRLSARDRPDELWETLLAPNKGNKNKNGKSKRKQNSVQGQQRQAVAEIMPTHVVGSSGPLCRTAFVEHAERLALGQLPLSDRNNIVVANAARSRAQAFCESLMVVVKRDVGGIKVKVKDEDEELGDKASLQQVFAVSVDWLTECARLDRRATELRYMLAWSLHSDRSSGDVVKPEKLPDDFVVKQEFDSNESQHEQQPLRQRFLGSGQRDQPIIIPDQEVESGDELDERGIRRKIFLPPFCAHGERSVLRRAKRSRMEGDRSNIGRLFYSCPTTYHRPTCGFYAWSDNLGRVVEVVNAGVATGNGQRKRRTILPDASDGTVKLQSAQYSIGPIPTLGSSSSMASASASSGTDPTTKRPRVDSLILQLDDEGEDEDEMCSRSREQDARKTDEQVVARLERASTEAVSADIAASPAASLLGNDTQLEKHTDVVVHSISTNILASGINLLDADTQSVSSEDSQGTVPLDDDVDLFVKPEPSAAEDRYVRAASMPHLVAAASVDDADRLLDIVDIKKTRPVCQHWSTPSAVPVRGVIASPVSLSSNSIGSPRNELRHFGLGLAETVTPALGGAAPTREALGVMFRNSNFLQPADGVPREYREDGHSHDSQVAFSPTSSLEDDYGDSHQNLHEGQQQQQKLRQQKQDQQEAYLAAASIRSQGPLARMRENFVCQQVSGKAAAELEENPNKYIIDILKGMERKASGDAWRVRGYIKAAASIRQYPLKITTVEQVRSLPNIGQKMLLKIQEILDTGRLRQLEVDDPIQNARQELNNVWGAGPATVERWIAAGFRHVSDLDWEKHPEVERYLVPNTKVGLRHYYDFLERIPRDEVRQLEAVVAEHLLAIDPNLKLCTCGSYRRGKPSCGDIDIIITHRLDHPTEGVLQELLRRLHIVGFLTDDLTSGGHYGAKERDHETDKNGKYMGVCRLPGVDPATGHTYKHRRIDLRIYPLTEWPTAILYFTGSGHFNRSMRLWAKKNSFQLSDHALRRRVSSGDDKVESEIPIQVKTERDVFRVLGLQYKEPHERDA